MLFLKRTLPLIITFISGLIMIVAFFSAEGLPKLKELDDLFPKWIQIIMTFTMVLGAVSLLKINLIKITRRVEGWGYNLVLVIGFLTMSIVGMFLGTWPMLDQECKPGEKYWLTYETSTMSESVEVVKVEPNEDGSVKVFVKNAAGTEMSVQASRLRGTLMAGLHFIHQMMFHGIFKAAQATMFSLLAFFVASASFRAFRVKSREAALLMGAAFVVMLGNVPVGNFITFLFAKIGLGFLDITALKEWIMTYPSSAAQSAILIGAMLGYISASMKVILGVERSYLGGES